MRLQIAAAFATLTICCLGQGPPGCCLAQPPVKRYISTFNDVAPLLIAGGEWTTQIVLTSYRTAQVTIPISFYGQDGNPLIVPLVGQPAASQISVTIPPKGTVFVQTQQPSNSIVGWALTDIPCSTADDCGNVLGQVILRNHVAVRPDYEAVFPFADSSASHLVMQFDNSANFDTTIIITNAENYSFSSPMVVTLAFYDGSGNRIGLDQLTIPVAGSTFFSMYQMYPQLRGQRGYVDLTALNGDLVAAGLRINPTNAFAPILSFEP